MVVTHYCIIQIKRLASWRWVMVGKLTLPCWMGRDPPWRPCSQIHSKRGCDSLRSNNRWIKGFHTVCHTAWHSTTAGGAQLTKICQLLCRQESEHEHEHAHETWTSTCTCICSWTCQMSMPNANRTTEPVLQSAFVNFCLISFSSLPLANTSHAKFPILFDSKQANPTPICFFTAIYSFPRGHPNNNKSYRKRWQLDDTCLSNTRKPLETLRLIDSGTKCWQNFLSTLTSKNEFDRKKITKTAWL